MLIFMRTRRAPGTKKRVGSVERRCVQTRPRHGQTQAEVDAVIHAELSALLDGKDFTGMDGEDPEEPLPQ